MSDWRDKHDDHPSVHYHIGRATWIFARSRTLEGEERMVAKVYDEMAKTTRVTFAREVSLAFHRTSGLNKRHGWIEHELTRILNRVPAGSIPDRILGEDLADFALGYYHEQDVQQARRSEAANDDAAA